MTVLSSTGMDSCCSLSHLCPFRQRYWRSTCFIPKRGWQQTCTQEHFWRSHSRSTCCGDMPRHDYFHLMQPTQKGRRPRKLPGNIASVLHSISQPSGCRSCPKNGALPCVCCWRCSLRSEAGQSGAEKRASDAETFADHGSPRFWPISAAPLVTGAGNNPGRGFKQPLAGQPLAQLLQDEHARREWNDEGPDLFSDGSRSEESISPWGVVDQQEDGDFRYHAQNDQRIAEKPGGKDRSGRASAHEHVHDLQHDDGAQAGGRGLQVQGI